MSVGGEIPNTPFLAKVSPLRLNVDFERYAAPIWVHEARELLRGFAGALFVALPLLYTQEMWERAREINAPTLLLILGIAFAVNIGYHSYTGFKVSRARTHLLWDTVTSFGLGALASIITLYLTARIQLDTPLITIVQLVALMSVPTSFGASLAINQLGQRSYSDRQKQSIADAKLPEDWEKITATILGGFLFAFNIVPTIEPRLMIVEVSSYHAIGIVVFSLAISYGIEEMARFQDEKNDMNEGLLRDPWLNTLVCYLFSLATCGVLLWMFGYINTGTPPEMWVPYMCVVGYAATLGGTAGRLVL